MIDRRVRQLSDQQRERLAALIHAHNSKSSLEQQSRRQLVAWFTCENLAPPTNAELRKLLQEKLPASVIPHHFEHMQSLPRTTTGKVDRAALTGMTFSALPVKLQVSATGSALETKLFDVFAKVLGTQQFKATDNFFELGGDSLASIKVIAICNQSDLRITPGQFHDNPTVKGLAESLTVRKSPPDKSGIRDRRTTRGEEPAEFKASPRSGQNSMTDASISTMRLSPHSQGPPLFLFPPKGFAVSCFRHLVSHISDVTCYSPVMLQSNSADHMTVEELAELFIERIRMVQPSGPYRLAGTCEGAYIAWTIACQLRAEGEEIRFLGIIDTPNPVAMHEKPLSTRVRRRIRSLDKTSPGKFISQVTRRAVSWVHRRVLRVFSREHHLTKAGSRMGWLFRPPVFDGRATLFRAVVPIEESDFTADTTHGWGNLASQGLDICSMSCDRLRLFDPPYAEILAHRIETAIQTAEVNCRYQP